jgi:hypothetical protein
MEILLSDHWYLSQIEISQQMVDLSVVHSADHSADHWADQSADTTDLMMAWYCHYLSERLVMLTDLRLLELSVISSLPAYLNLVMA